MNSGALSHISATNSSWLLSLNRANLLTFIRFQVLSSQCNESNICLSVSTGFFTNRVSFVHSSTLPITLLLTVSSMDFSSLDCLVIGLPTRLFTLIPGSISADVPGRIFPLSASAIPSLKSSSKPLAKSSRSLLPVLISPLRDSASVIFDKARSILRRCAGGRPGGSAVRMSFLIESACNCFLASSRRLSFRSSLAV